MFNVEPMMHGERGDPVTADNLAHETHLGPTLEEKIDWIYDALRKLMPVVEKLLRHPMLNRWLK